MEKPADKPVPGRSTVRRLGYSKLRIVWKSWFRDNLPENTFALTSTWQSHSNCQVNDGIDFRDNEIREERQQ
jgi:hypothetical protein